MSVFEHTNFGDPKIFSDNPHSYTCIYCQSKLSTLHIDDLCRWEETDNNQILKIHEATSAVYKEIHGLEDHYLNLDFEEKFEEVWLNYCPKCGWWRVIKDVCISAEVWQYWDIFFGLSGTIKSLDLNDINLPIDEVSRYLFAKYESRFSIHPRLFEEVVASVFKTVGFNVFVTGYSNDGGIDVILGKEEEAQIGIQVKRYKNKIKVEQIRAFAGALILSDFKKGIFVTTSEFQPAAIKASEKYKTKTLPIELVNSKTFYEALKIAQKPNVDLDLIIDSLKNKSQQLFEYGWDTPRHTL